MFDDPHNHPPHGIDRNRKSDPGTGTGGTVNGHVDPDQSPLGIQEGSSGISRVDGRIGLDAALDGSAADALDVASEGRDDSGGEGVVESEGVAYGKDGLAYLEGGGGADGEWRGELKSVGGGVGGRGQLEFEDGEVFFGFVADDGGVERVEDSLEFDFDARSGRGGLDGRGDDVIVGYDVSLCGIRKEYIAKQGCNI